MTTELLVGKEDDFESGGPQIVLANGREVAVLRVDGTFHAFSNVCLHQGGPVGEGTVLPRVEAVVDENGRLQSEKFSSEILHLICPWHGWEYDLTTGQCVADRSLSLRKYQVKVRSGDVFIVLNEEVAHS